MKFLNVSCSQCGQEFGPGDHGFSMCRDHRTKLENLKIAYERVGTLADCDLDLMNCVDARFLREAHDLMPQLLAAVDTLADMAQLAYDATQYDVDDLRAEDMKRIDAAFTILKGLKS